VRGEMAFHWVAIKDKQQEAPNAEKP